MLVIFIQTLFYRRDRRVNIGFDNEQRYLSLRCVYHSYVAPRIRGGFEYPRRNARTSLHFSSAYGYLAVTGADAYFYLFVFGSELSRYLEHAAEIVVADRKRKPRMRTVRQKLRDHVNVYSRFGNFSKMPAMKLMSAGESLSEKESRFRSLLSIRLSSLLRILSVYHVAHAVESRFFVLYEFCGVHGSRCE